MSGVRDVETFLTKLGLEQSIQAVVHNGFYTSMEALKGATYEELVDSGVRPVHAKLIISHLGSSMPMPLGTPMPAGNEAMAEEVATFLRGIGLENCVDTLMASGFNSLDALGEAGTQELLAAGLKPVHARLIVSARTRNVVRDNILLMKHPHETKLAELAAQEQVAGRRRCDSRHASGVKET